MGRNTRTGNADTDTGQVAYPVHAAGLHTHPFPMRSYNGSLVAKRNRQAPTSDVDTLPHQFRQYVNVGARDVQIWNGLRWRVGAGIRKPMPGTGFLYAIVPRIPGQQRGDVAGFHKRGPSPLNVQNLWQAGPGSQPSNPGGPGTVAGPTLINPMTG